MNKVKEAWHWLCRVVPLVEPATFERWSAHGICSDGTEFTYICPFYVRVSGITCDAPSWIADFIRKDGYYRVGEQMFYIPNVISVEWRRLEQITNTIPYEQWNMKINYSPAEMFAEIQAAKKLLKS